MLVRRRRQRGGIESSCPDDDLNRMRQRVEKGGPSGHNRSLFGLALDPKGERLAFEDGTERSSAEIDCRVTDRLDGEDVSGAL